MEVNQPCAYGSKIPLRWAGDSGKDARAREAGFVVSGQDKNVYPPMSTQLQELGIAMHSGYDADALLAVKDAIDTVLVGNVMTRGVPVVEALLDQKLPYTSGPQWLGEQVLRQRQDRWRAAQFWHFRSPGRRQAICH